MSSVSEKQMHRARRIAGAGLATFWVAVAAIASATSGSEFDRIPLLQTIGALMSSPFLYAGLLRVVEPAILLRYSERRVENVVIDGQRAQISRTGAGKTARLDRKRAWIFAMAPTAVLYGGALALSLTLSGTLSPGLVGAMIVSAVLVVAIGPLAMHMRKNLLAARELRTPQVLAGTTRLTAANGQLYRVEYEIRYQVAPDGMQKLVVAFSDNDTTSAPSLVRPLITDALSSWRPERRELRDPATLASSSALLSSLRSQLAPLGLEPVDVSFGSADHLEHRDPAE